MACILTLDLEARLERYVEDMRAHVGAGRHEVHCALVVLVPHEVVAGGPRSQLSLERLARRREHLEEKKVEVANRLARIVCFVWIHYVLDIIIMKLYLFS